MDLRRGRGGLPADRPRPGAGGVQDYRQADQVAAVREAGFELGLIPTFVMIDTLTAGSACSLSHREMVGVRGSGLSRVRNPLTPTLSPSGRGSRPRSRHRQRIKMRHYRPGLTVSGLTVLLRFPAPH